MRKLKTAGLIAFMVVVILCLSACQESTEAKYERAQKLMTEGKYFDATALFDQISTYEDSSKLSMYAKAIAVAEEGQYDSAISSFSTMGDFKDSRMMITYYTARKYENAADSSNWSMCVTAAEYYDMVNYFLDSSIRADKCRQAVYDEAVRIAGNGEFGQSIEMLNTLPQFSDSADLSKYYAAFKLEQEEKFSEAAAAFAELGEYRNAAQQAVDVLQRGYDKADVLEKAGNQDEACAVFASLGDFSDAFERANKPYYDQGVAKREEKDWYAAMLAFEKAGTYSDAADQILETKYQQAEYKREQQNWDEAVRLFTDLKEYKDAALQVNETYYQQANSLEENGDQEGAYDLFISLGRYKDANDRANKPYYDLGLAKREAQEWDEAIAALSKIGNYNDTAEQINETYYQQASAMEASGDQEGAYTLFMSLGEYSDAFDRANKPYYDLGVAKRDAGEWEEAVAAFTHAGTYSDAESQINATYYAEGQAKRSVQDWDGARAAFGKAGEYTDAKDQILSTWYMEGKAKFALQDWDGARTAFGNADEYSDAKDQILAVWYAEGKAKQEAKEWDAAVDAFTQAGSYSDAMTQIAATRFLEGKDKEGEGDWDGAIAAYEAAGEYGEAARRIQECLYGKTISLCEKAKAGEVSAQQAIDAMLAISDTELFREARDYLKDADLFRDLWTTEFTAGNTVYLGKYEQDNNPENGPEAIAWKVLYSLNGEALLLSERVIDAMPFITGEHRTDLGEINPDEIWQKSDIYNWLTEQFAGSFSQQEAALINANEAGGSAFILDNKEYKQYCSEEESVEATAYAVSKDETHHDLLNYYKDENGNRTHGNSVMQWIRTGAVRADGYIYPDDLGMVAGVRPAVWISINRGPTDEWIENHFALPQEE